MSVDYGCFEFDHPAHSVKTVNVDPIPQRVFDGMKKYEDANRTFGLVGFEHETVNLATKRKDVNAGLLISHRPEGEQVAQIYRIPTDPLSTDLQRLTYFDDSLGTGRKIGEIVPIVGEDWRGIWRGGGAIFVMDLNGNEMYQLWRYWEDSLCDGEIPQIEGEIENKSPVGRLERLTHDEFKYSDILISDSHKFIIFASNKENKRDTYIYLSQLIVLEHAKTTTAPFTLPSQLIAGKLGEGTTRWHCQDISVDDKYVLLLLMHGNSHRPLYLIDLSTGSLEEIILPNSPEGDIANAYATFSRDPAFPHLLYLVTDAYGDFRSAITYDLHDRTIMHITTPDPILSLRSIPWDIASLTVIKDRIYFKANIQGWDKLFVMELAGPQKNIVVEIKPGNWNGGMLTFCTNAKNDRPSEVVIRLVSHDTQGCIVRTKVLPVPGVGLVAVPSTTYTQVSSPVPPFRTLPPQLISIKSFDGIEVPCMYYHPSDRKGVIPVVISIHGGPEGQSKSQSRISIHWYLLNELGCAVIYPNVRGSSGYGKKYMAADDVFKREDSVKDIGALIDHIQSDLKGELDGSRIAVMGGSYGGYMVFACLTHFSEKLCCGLANFGIAHWASFLRNTAALRRDFRRKEYGDERIPEVLEFMESISPVNNAHKISIPLSIAHGESDTRVTIHEAVNMWDIVTKNGVHAELIVCEKEGHGFKQKSVIEYTNAAKIQFLEQFLFHKSSL